MHITFIMQVNGGSVEEKVDFGYNLFEQTVSVDSVFQPNEMLDTIAITKGKGTEGVVTRWGVTRLPRKTHRGLRKVSCTSLPCMAVRLFPAMLFACVSIPVEALTLASASWSLQHTELVRTVLLLEYCKISQSMYASFSSSILVPTSVCLHL